VGFAEGNVLVPFPALVTGSGPITLTKLNGVWKIGFTISAFGSQNPPIGNYATDSLIGFDAIAQQFFQVSFKNLLAVPVNTPPTTQTGNYTVAQTDASIIFNGAGSITVTLPAAAANAGRWLILRTIAAQTVVSASSNVVPLAGGAAGTAILAATAGKFAALQSDGTNWQTMMAN